MVRSLFTRLKKYAGTEISQGENYATELLANLLYELPAYRHHLLDELFRIPIAEEVTIKTQQSYQTRRFGRAILDLVIEDGERFIMIEVKVGAGINIYEAHDEIDEDIYDQIQKYEDCIGLPEGKEISIFTLTQHTPRLRHTRHRYHKVDVHSIRWHELYRVTN